MDGCAYTFKSYICIWISICICTCICPIFNLFLMHVCTFLYIYMYMYICIYWYVVCICVRIYVCLCMCVYTCVYIYIDVCVHTCVYMFGFICACHLLYTYMYMSFGLSQADITQSAQPYLTRSRSSNRRHETDVETEAAESQVWRILVVPLLGEPAGKCVCNLHKYRLGSVSRANESWPHKVWGLLLQGPQKFE